MPQPQKNSYDAIIIGAGISGLVCGCFLAKAGLKVLIVEQHHKPGGYCTSFKRKGFAFDAAAHSFGSYREGGHIKKVLDDLDLSDKMEIRRYDPSDIIITPDFQLTLHNNLNKTIENISSIFPAEKHNITRFFDFLSSISKSDYIKLRTKTFNDILISFLNNDKLRNALALPVFGNGALPPSLMHAYTAITLFKEFLLDGGYYFEQGMQTLPNALGNYIIKNKGTILYKKLATKIIFRNNTVTGIRLNDDNIYTSHYVISAGDVFHAFKQLIGEKKIGGMIIKKIEKMSPTLSAFILYIGLKNELPRLPPVGTNIWHLPYYDVDEIYHRLSSKTIHKPEAFTFRVSPDKKTIIALANFPYRSPQFWKYHRKKIEKDLLRRVGEIIPHIEKNIAYYESATPYTLHNYTLNYRGAAFGWESSATQLFEPVLSLKSAYKGLYFTGHWTTQAHGIPGVAFLGRNTAKLILKKEKSAAS